MSVFARRFNDDGLAAFAGYVDLLQQHPTQEVPVELLQDYALTELVQPAIRVDQVVLASRMDAARSIEHWFQQAGHEPSSRDPGFWAWMSLFLFDSVCPADGNGRRFPRSRARHVPDLGFQRYYRHLLLGPFLILKAHQDDPARALCLLCGALHRPGDLVEQLSSRADLVSNPTFVAMATRLYVDLVGGTLKPGAGGAGGGSPRRLAKVMAQLELTWDARSMTPDQLVDLLPKEFDRFRL